MSKCKELVTKNKKIFLQALTGALFLPFTLVLYFSACNSSIYFQEHCDCAEFTNFFFSDFWEITRILSIPAILSITYIISNVFIKTQPTSKEQKINKLFRSVNIALYVLSYILYLSV